MSEIGLSEAAKLAGTARSTLYRAIKGGRLSAAVGRNGAVRIDVAELERVFPVAVARDNGATSRETVRNSSRPAELVARVAELEARVSEKDSLITAHERTIDDLRSRLDAEAEERRKVQVQLTAVLTDQRTPTPAVEPPRGLWGKFLAWRR